MSLAWMSEEQFREHMNNVHIQNADHDYKTMMDLASKEYSNGNVVWSNRLRTAAEEYYSSEMKKIADGVYNY